MKPEKDSYDVYLEPIALRFAKQVEWAIPLPRLLRWWVGRYIEGLPDASSASNFVCRNPSDPVSNRLREAYQAAFGRDYNMLSGGYCRRHWDFCLKLQGTDAPGATNGSYQEGWWKWDSPLNQARRESLKKVQPESVKS